MSNRPIIVLKFGGSVLAHERDLPDAVHEIYRWVREGWSVVAVVSALGRTTDRLLAQGHQYGNSPDAASLASLVATGEHTSASLLSLALHRAGVPAEILDAARIRLRTSGAILDAEPTSVDEGEIRAVLSSVRVAVVPGFLGRSEEGRQTLLGRGGSDFTALFLAACLEARCRLVKDVRGLYERDPAKPGPLARRFRSLTWDDALRLDGRIVQHKGVRFARDRGLSFEVAAANCGEATIVGPTEIEFAIHDERLAQPLRVGLLGLGTVGYGVFQHLSRRPDLYELTGIAVTNPKRHADNGVPLYLLTNDPASVVRSGCDVVIECVGDPSVAYPPLAAALRAGKHVITANEALVAAHGPELARLADEHGVRCAHSAAAGSADSILGVVPGKGAGRWPAAEAVVGDLLALVREQTETASSRGITIRPLPAREIA